MADCYEATSRAVVDTEYSADAIEFCPANRRVFACGTYQIQQELLAPSASRSASQDEEDDRNDDTATPKVTRKGRCLVYEISPDGSRLQEIQRMDGAAILDMKWSTQLRAEKTTLAIADAKGHINLHSWDNVANRLSHLQTVQCADEDTLVLSLDWADRRHQTGPSAIVASLSNGSICALAGDSELRVNLTWHAHDFEPWIAAFDCWHPATVWTGGDDCKLKGWDLRDGCTQPTFVNKKFEGGVTTIQSHPLLENIFAVGSYDSQIRLFDRRKPQTPLHECTAAGGIWRLKWHSHKLERLLVAAMHGGFEVVDFDGLASQVPTGVASHRHCKYDGHASLAYGVDWSGLQTLESEDIVASCSFYDHSAHVWSVPQ